MENHNVEKYICRISFDKAYNLFVNCKSYKGQINTMTKIRSMERYVFIPGSLRRGFLKRRNKLEMKDWVDIFGYMKVLNHPNENINSADSLFYVREDGMTLRQKTDYDNHPDRRDYLFMMDKELMDKLLLSGEMLPLNELREKAERKEPHVMSYYRNNYSSE